MEIVGSNNFLMQFIKIIFHYKICYKINALRLTAYLVVNPITFSIFALILTLAGYLRFYDGFDLKTYFKMRELGPDALSVV